MVCEQLGWTNRPVNYVALAPTMPTGEDFGYPEISCGTDLTSERPGVWTASENLPVNLCTRCSTLSIKNALVRPSAGAIYAN
jgi:hypothetical protein